MPSPVLAPSLDDVDRLLAVARRAHDPGTRRGVKSLQAQLQDLGIGFWPRWLLLMAAVPLLLLLGWCSGR